VLFTAVGECDDYWPRVWDVVLAVGWVLWCWSRISLCLELRVEAEIKWCAVLLRGFVSLVGRNWGLSWYGRTTRLDSVCRDVKQPIDTWWW
jgi:hypothetical protein